MGKLLKVNGMHCKSCELLLTDVLSEINGVTNVEISQAKGTVKFDYENEHVVKLVKDEIKKNGYLVLQ
ncbi:MAG: heavy metal-associated domain-containing protein [Candidatus Micrarchaeota archaeon]